MPIDQEKFSDTYATWMGIPVFLNVIAGGIKTSLFCTIIGESNATVRVRIGNQWDVDTYKEMVLAVDEFPCPDRILVHENPEAPARQRESIHLPANACVGISPQ